MMSLTFDLFTQVSGSGPLGPLVLKVYKKQEIFEHMVFSQSYENMICKG